MPVIWVIDPYRAGERSQVHALARALDPDYLTRRLVYRDLAIGAKLFRRTSLSGIDRSRSDALEPPWPDLVLTSGMANEPVCRWIRRASGGRSRIVHVGRPWTHPRDIDLVITTPQYPIAEHEHVLRNDLTLNNIDEAWLVQRRSEWQAKFEALPRPWLSVIVGGNSGPFTLGSHAAARLGSMAAERARALGGSLLVTTSARTSHAAVQVLRETLGDVSHSLYQWRADDPENPYPGILACADEHIVTADSISMISEACASGAPVRLFDIGGMRKGVTSGPRDSRPGGVLYRVLMQLGPAVLSRDITRVHERLLQAGRCGWLGDEEDVPGGAGGHDLERALARVAALSG